jgi:radical SAM superfamily enzyme YgiQ (UPF0313 family)
MRVLLISTYELGRQPFGLASPAAWLRQAGARVRCLDLSRERLDEEAVRAADLVAFYVPMHTATRIATQVIGRVKETNPAAHLCFYGLYASVNEPFLLALGADTVLGGEFEAGLLSLVRRLGANGAKAGFRPPAEATGSFHLTAAPVSLWSAPAPNGQPEPLVSLAKQRFLVPDRTGLPELSSYARLNLGNGSSRTVGYTEASRGCKHLCRHCPIVPVYRGTFRVVQRDVVLEDVRRQVAAGAEHVTFGDPDFFNGVGHARAIVRALHAEHPRLTYDVTIKVEHLLKHARELATLRETGCVLVTTAVESIDDRVLAILDKGHTRDDVVQAIRLCHEEGLNLNPTFVAFTPWISLAGYQDLLSFLAEQELIDQVAPIQLAIRLLVPAGSRLLELPEVRGMVGPFDRDALVHPWHHEDPRVDRLQGDVQALVQRAAASGAGRREVFSRVWQIAEGAAAGSAGRSLPAGSRTSPGDATGGRNGRHARLQAALARPKRAPVPYLTEPWYC